MAGNKDFIEILREIRGSGAPGDVYTDGIYHDIVSKTTDSDNAPRLGAGIYGSIQTMYSNVGATINSLDQLLVLEAMSAVLQSLYADKATLDSLYADKITLDSLYADKITLDSLYADKITLDSLYADKLTFDSIFTDKAKLDSLFTDKATLDSLYADKIKLDSLYADKLTLDSLYASKAVLDSLFVDKIKLDSLYADKTKLDSIYADKAKLDSIFTDKVTLDALYADIVKGIGTNQPTDSAILNALTNATISTAQAGIATTKAGETAASAASALNSLNTFQGQYKSSPTEPVTPVLGNLWFDETTFLMKIYDGAIWKLAGSSVNGTSERQVYIATAGQTIFNVTYDVGFVDVYLNSGKLQATVDFTATNGTSITLTLGANLNDIVDIVAYGTFSIADTYTKASIDAKDVLKADQATTYTKTEVDTALAGKLATTATAADTTKVLGGTISVSVSAPSGGVDNDWWYMT